MVDKGLKETIKQVYGVILFFVILSVFISYQIDLFQIKTDVTSYLFLALLIVLAFLPLVKEIQILNIIKLKKDFDEFRESVDNKLSILQNTVINSINQNQSVQISTKIINGDELRTKHTLLKKEINKIPKKKIDEIKYNIKNEYNIDDFNVKFLKNSIKIEKILNELFKLNDIQVEYLPRNMHYINRFLFQNKIINEKLYAAINTFLLLRNNVVHGIYLSRSDLKIAIKFSENIIFLLNWILYNRLKSMQLKQKNINNDY
ncbi:MAG: hypothetical protein KAS90_00980 [Candidatus Aenigmarchaeota archaeon]|nr:hypothetical protein [Candidatus Aenigmarchaeota archaeon]